MQETHSTHEHPEGVQVQVYTEEPQSSEQHPTCPKIVLAYLVTYAVFRTLEQVTPALRR